MAYDATIVSQEDWETKLQERLTEPTIWKEICKVEYTNTKVLHNPYLTDAVVSTLSRGTAYTFKPIVETDENITIDAGAVTSSFIDRADLAQSQYANQMSMADSQGVLLDEYIGSYVFADHGSMTNFGAGDLAGTSAADSTTFTPSSTNIANVVTALKRTIYVNNGATVASRNGIFIVWTPLDFEILEQFCAANGYGFADDVLANGIGMGKRAFGVTHYQSNLLTAGHIIAGVKKMYHLGICLGTYGKVTVIQDPGLVSGIGVTSRVDYKGKVWTKALPVLFDVNVTA